MKNSVSLADEAALELPHGCRKRISRFGIIPLRDVSLQHMSQSVHSEDYKKIIRRLKEARINADLSQQDVANKLQKPQSYVSKIESGERRLDVAEIKKFAGVYKKDVSFFLK